MTYEVLAQPVPPAEVEPRASQREMTIGRTSLGGRAATSRDEAQAPAQLTRSDALSDAARPLGEWRSGLTRPGLRLVAAATLRILFMISIAMLLIFGLLPAVLSAQWARVG